MTQGLVLTEDAKMVDFGMILGGAASGALGALANGGATGGGATGGGSDLVGQLSALQSQSEQTQLGLEAIKNRGNDFSAFMQASASIENSKGKAYDAQINSINSINDRAFAFARTSARSG
jgi:hypothetical protein